MSSLPSRLTLVTGFGLLFAEERHWRPWLPFLSPSLTCSSEPGHGLRHCRLQVKGPGLRPVPQHGKFSRDVVDSQGVAGMLGKYTPYFSVGGGGPGTHLYCPLSGRGEGLTFSFTSRTRSRYGIPGFTISTSAPSCTSRSWGGRGIQQREVVVGGKCSEVTSRDRRELNPTLRSMGSRLVGWNGRPGSAGAYVHARSNTHAELVFWAKACKC